MSKLRSRGVQLRRSLRSSSLRPQAKRFFKKPFKFSWRQLFAVAGVALLALTILQLIYPSDRLTPGFKVDGVSVGWLTRDEAAARLRDEYANHQVELRLGSKSESVKSPKLSQLGIEIKAGSYLDNISYPWYLRLVPTSLWWGQSIKADAPEVEFSDKTNQYIEKVLMPNCRKQPVNASFKIDSDRLVVVPSEAGGVCEREEVESAIKSIRPNLTKETIVELPLKSIPSEVTDEAAKNLVELINLRVKDGLPIQAADEQIVVPAKEVLGWLTPKTAESVIDFAVEGERVDRYLNEQVAPKVAVTPGESQITTRDFDIVSRIDGQPGRAIDLVKTYASIYQFIAGQSSLAVAETIIVPPKEVYTRSYSSSDKGIAALLENFAKDNPGSYGVSYIELEGQKRRAEYQGDKQFVTASTYKLFTAYSLLKRVDDGRESWEANADCFNKMISLSDNPCAEAMLHKFGLTNITKEINAIGLKNSNFTKSGGPFTTANDLALLMGQLQTGQNFSPAGKDRLLSALYANVHRRGVPAGSAGRVANKVGFLNALLHDAAIVNGPKGTYVLAIMTEGSSWAKIAELTREIEKIQ